MPNKAIGAGGGAILAGAMVQLIVALWWKNAPPEVVSALNTVLGAVLSGLGAYLPKFEGGQ